MALVSLGAAWCLAWAEPRHGVVILSGTKPTATVKKGCLCSTAADRPWPCARHRLGYPAHLHSRGCNPDPMAAHRRRSDLFIFAIWKLWRARHPTWVGMRVNFWDLTTWSWLMATAHGAGLMVVPVLLGTSVFCGATPSSTNSLLFFSPLIATAAVGVHTISHLIMAGLVAWVVYDFVGLAVLRRSWINLDLIWCFSLLAAATVLIFAPQA
jgi:hypothetical protein